MKFTADAHARGDRDSVASVLWALMLYHALIGAVVVVVLTAGADRAGHWLMAGSSDNAARVADVLPTAGLWFALSGLNGVFVGVLRGVQRHAAAACVAGTALVIGVGGGALVVGRGHGLHAAALCQVLGALSAAARELRQMLSFSLWTLLGRLVQVAMLQGDKVVAARAVGAVGLPSYVVPFNLAQKLNILGSAAVTAVYPMAAANSARSRDEFRESYFRVARVVHLFTAAPAITLLVLAPLFLHSWIGPEMAASGAGFLRVLAVGYWIVSVASVEAGCLEGWGYPRVTALAASASLILAVVVAGVLASTADVLSAVAGGVAVWMTGTGLTSTIAWQRVSGFPATRLWQGLLRPVAEMVVLGIVAGEVAGDWLVPGPGGLLGCATLTALLLVYGFVRLFPVEERKLLLSRVAGLSGA
jgi:O-antigen/teichoic acid export membrane protein